MERWKKPSGRGRLPTFETREQVEARYESCSPANQQGCNRERSQKRQEIARALGPDSPIAPDRNATEGSGGYFVYGGPASVFAEDSLDQTLRNFRGKDLSEHFLTFEEKWKQRTNNGKRRPLRFD